MADVDIYLYPGETDPEDILLADPTQARPTGGEEELILGPSGGVSFSVGMMV